jgi:hypothetical protein
MSIHVYVKTGTEDIQDHKVSGDQLEDGDQPDQQVHLGRLALMLAQFQKQEMIVI